MIGSMYQVKRRRDAGRPVPTARDDSSISGPCNSAGCWVWYRGSGWKFEPASSGELGVEDPLPRPKGPPTQAEIAAPPYQPAAPAQSVPTPAQPTAPVQAPKIGANTPVAVATPQQLQSLGDFLTLVYNYNTPQDNIETYHVSTLTPDQKQELAYMQSVAAQLRPFFLSMQGKSGSSIPSGLISSEDMAAITKGGMVTVLSGGPYTADTGGSGDPVVYGFQAFNNMMKTFKAVQMRAQALADKEMEKGQKKAIAAATAYANQIGNQVVVGARAFMLNFAIGVATKVAKKQASNWLSQKFGAASDLMKKQQEGKKYATSLGLTDPAAIDAVVSAYISGGQKAAKAAAQPYLSADQKIAIAVKRAIKAADASAAARANAQLSAQQQALYQQWLAASNAKDATSSAQLQSQLSAVQQQQAAINKDPNNIQALIQSNSAEMQNYIQTIQSNLSAQFGSAGAVEYAINNTGGVDNAYSAMLSGGLTPSAAGLILSSFGVSQDTINSLQSLPGGEIVALPVGMHGLGAMLLGAIRSVLPFADTVSNLAYLPRKKTTEDYLVLAGIYAGLFTKSGNGYSTPRGSVNAIAASNIARNRLLPPGIAVSSQSCSGHRGGFGCRPDRNSANNIFNLIGFSGGSMVKTTYTINQDGSISVSKSNVPKGWWLK